MNKLFKNLSFIIPLLFLLYGCSKPVGPLPSTKHKVFFDGINCIADNQEEYEEGKYLKFTITPSEDYVLPTSKNDITVTGVDDYEYIFSGEHENASFSCKMLSSDINVSVSAGTRPDPIDLDYLCLTCTTGSSYAKFYVQNVLKNIDSFPDIEYSRDKAVWIPLDPTIPFHDGKLTEGSEFYFRGNNPDGFAAYGGTHFHLSSNFNGMKFSTGGNIMSLVKTSNFNNILIPESSTDCFKCLFAGEKWITDASELKLPANTAPYCYQGMFFDCARLTEPPELPAEVMCESCYQGMFEYCYSLTEAPELPATTLGELCYYGMFEHCNGLVTACELPATTLADGCYKEMFYDTGLIESPALPATTLPSHCYDTMFANCMNLTIIGMMGTEEGEVQFAGDYALVNMFAGCEKLKLTRAPYSQQGIKFFKCTDHRETDLLKAASNMFKGVQKEFLEDTPYRETEYRYIIN